MQIWELFIIALGLSMDAFAVSVCKGLSVRRLKLSHALICGLYFGGFQALMPFLGYFIVSRFNIPVSKIEVATGVISFVLLALIGGNMIREALSGGEETAANDSFTPRVMLPLALATSIDALAVGVTFALQPEIKIGLAVALIGAVTLAVAAAGVWIGKLFGTRYKAKAEVFGGVILILMGGKILLEHIGVLA